MFQDGKVWYKSGWAHYLPLPWPPVCFCWCTHHVFLAFSFLGHLPGIQPQVRTDPTRGTPLSDGEHGWLTLTQPLCSSTRISVTVIPLPVTFADSQHWLLCIFYVYFMYILCIFYAYFMYMCNTFVYIKNNSNALTALNSSLQNNIRQTTCGSSQTRGSCRGVLWHEPEHSETTWTPE